MDKAPILRIGDLKFEIEQNFSDGYHNNIRSPSEITNTSHPTHFMWAGGEFKPINIALNLAVGVQSAITTPQELITVLKTLYLYCLPPRPVGSVPPEPIEISMGDWYRKAGRISDLDVTYMYPWDVKTGMPMRAEVRFVFIIDYLAYIESSSGKKNPALLPDSRDWDFNYIAGSKGNFGHA